MSVTPTGAPWRPAYVQDAATGLYYRMGGGGGGTGLPVFVGVLAANPDPMMFSQWVVTPDAGPWDSPLAEGTYSLMVSNGTSWFPIAGTGGGATGGARPTAAFTSTVHWADVSVDGSTSSDPDGFIAAYDWDWGDGSTHGTGALATHSYATGGTKAITLTVTDDDGDQHQVLHTVSTTKMYGPVTFTTTGSTFSPWLYLVADSTNQIEWINTATSTVVATTAHPTISFGSTGTRTIQLWQSRPEDVLTVNLGYNSGDDTGNFQPGISGGSVLAGYTYAGQLCSGVTGLGVLTNLVNFMAANSPMTGTLTFDGLTHLEFIECAYAHVTGCSVAGCTSLIRFCLEQNNLNGATIDLNPVRNNLKDLRMAYQGGVVFTPLTGPLTQLYHLCTRDQPITNMPKMPNIPAVTEHWTWNDSQSGTFVAPPTIFDMRIADNSYTALDLTGTPSAPTLGRIDASRNPFTSITGMATGRQFNLVQFVGNGMTQALVDQVLANVNAWGTSNGTLQIDGNAAPTGGSSGNTNAVALRARGWAVTTG